MDCCSQPNLLPVSHAIKSMLGEITPINTSEKVGLAEALDRVLSEPIYSSRNVPSNNNSAMDGYALRHDDLATTKSFRIIGHSSAGHPCMRSIRPGECVRIMTGAVIPEGADTVVMQENVNIETDCIQITKPAMRGENIRRAGEDIALNALVYTVGKRVSPVDIGLLASLGVDSVSVFKRIKVAVLSTGDELKTSGGELGLGEIFDSNRPTLIALLSRLGADVVDIGCIADCPEKISSAFNSARSQADVVISSGGVSVGDADYTKEVLERIGTINFWKVAIKPGKPFAFGQLKNIDAHGEKDCRNQCWFFGLPGNPVSTIVTYHQLVLPALRHLSGEKYDSLPMFQTMAKRNLKKQPGRTDYQRGKLSKQNGANEVAPAGSQSSGSLSSFAQANCYIVLESDRSDVRAGELVDIVPFDKFLL